MALAHAITPAFAQHERAAADDPHVRLAGVSKRLGSLQAVDNVSLDIERGAIVTLLGPSGCGKSTTLRLLAGLYQPDAGQILLDNTDITYLPPNQRRMTMVFQEYALFPHLTIADNVAYGLRMRGVSGTKTSTRVGEMLELVGLATSSAKYPHQLSGGQQQRVALARALAIDPEVLLLDEPLSNLDAKLRVKLREEIVRLHEVLGKTMIFVTHDQEEALSISDKIAVMGEGRIVQLGTPEDIYFRPATHYVADFIGLANFIPVEVRVTGSIMMGDRSMPCKGATSTGQFTLMIRPESLSLAPQARPDAVAFPATVIRRSFLGSNVRYWVQTKLGEWIVDDVPSGAASLENDCFVTLDMGRLHLLPR